MSKQEFEEKIEKLISNITDYYSVKVEENKYKYKTITEIRIYRKYLEVTAYCEEITENKEEFEECFIESLEEINNESSIPLELTYAGKDLVIESYPILCDSNYCEVGLGIEVISISELDYEELYKVIEYIIRLAFSLLEYDFIVTGKNISKILESS